ncbi:MAG: hypothetical protein J6D08_09810 [Lachnospiraceae bacterium]|nr:hypothetical protein [Lachnospiraceae bacterium]
MQMLEQIKKSLRISHNALDDILISDIYAGADELLRVGVNPFEIGEDGEYQTDSDGRTIISEKPLVRKALELYAKGMEDFDEKGKAYMESFEALRDSLSLSGDYNEKRTGCTDNNSQQKE